jgi:Protein of unknown function (DUF998)
MVQVPVAPAPSQRTLLANVVIGGFLYALAVLVLLHFLRPDYSPRTHMISDYAVGPFGWLMKSVFIAMSVADLSLALGLARSGLRSFAARFAMFLLVVVSIGLIVSAIFPTDLEESPVDTRAGKIHTISFLINVACSILVAVLLPVGYGSHSGWRPFRSKAALLASLALLAVIIQFRMLHRGAPYGIANRAFVVILFAWTLATALRLRAELRHGIGT